MLSTYWRSDGQSEVLRQIRVSSSACENLLRNISIKTLRWDSPQGSLANFWRKIVDKRYLMFRENFCWLTVIVVLTIYFHVVFLCKWVAYIVKKYVNVMGNICSKRKKATVLKVLSLLCCHHRPLVQSVMCVSKEVATGPLNFSKCQST